MSNIITALVAFSFGALYGVIMTYVLVNDKREDDDHDGL